LTLRLGGSPESCVRWIPEGVETDILHAEGVWGARGEPAARPVEKVPRP
jgi:hypothetical protein